LPDSAPIRSFSTVLVDAEGGRLQLGRNLVEPELDRVLGRRPPSMIVVLSALTRTWAARPAGRPSSSPG